MKHSLAVVAGLVATFTLGAVVALYGPSLTAKATGCFAYRPNSVQYRQCWEDVVERCEDTIGSDDRSSFVACLRAGTGGDQTIYQNRKEAGDSQKQHNAGGENAPRK